MARGVSSENVARETRYLFRWSGIQPARGLLLRCGPHREEIIAKPDYGRVENDTGAHTYVHKEANRSYYEGNNEEAKHPAGHRA